MSDQIPFHIQEEIMKRLPVKSLIQFRSVSKAWKSLIDSSEFIAAHSLRRHTQPQHLLVMYDHPLNNTSYIDDDTFPQQRSVLTLPLSVKQLSIYLIRGSSHGLFGLYKPGNNLKPGMVVLWNPSIRKSIVVDVPGGGEPSVGFGVSPVTSDPKIVSVTQSWDKSNIEASYQCEVMVYTLSSGKWRSLSDNLPTKLIQHFWCTMVTDRFIYWRAGSQSHNMIMSFDVTNESFEVIALPDCVANRYVYVSKLRESFVIIEYNRSVHTIGTVWMLEHGVQRAFTKLFTVETPHNFIVAFTKSGIPIVKVTDDPDDSDYDDELSKLVVCRPNSEHNNVLQISHDNFTVESYMETLVLLGQSDCNSY